MPDLAQVIEFDFVTGEGSQPVGELVAQIYEYQSMIFEMVAPEGVNVEDEAWKGILSFNSAVAEEHRKCAGE